MGSEDDFAEAEALLEALEAGKPIPKTKKSSPDSIAPNTNYNSLNVGDLVLFSNREYSEFLFNPISSICSVNTVLQGKRFLKGFVISKEPSSDIIRVRSFFLDNTSANIPFPTYLDYRVVASRVQLLDKNVELDVPNDEEVVNVQDNLNVNISNYLKEQKRKRLEEEQAKKIAEEEKRKKELKGVQGKIDEIKAIAEEIHPGRWDFGIIEPNDSQFKVSGDAGFRLTIHFPELTITNSDKRSHKITDLYIIMFFKNNMEHTGSIYGNRGTISYPELCSSYRHSHLRSSNDGNWGTFCLGDSTATSQIINGLVADRWNPALFRSCLTLLYTYSEWESLEGGPHIRMSAITTNSRVPTMNVDDSTKQRCFLAFIKRYENFPASLVVEGDINTFKVNVTEEFEKLVTDILPSQDFLVIKQLNGEYTPREVNSRDMTQRINDFNNYARRNASNAIHFKEQVLYTKVIDSSLNPENTTSLVANPRITNYIAFQLEKEMNQYQLKMESYELG